MAVLTITQENFEAEVLQSDKPVLVDFWATWCGPCRMIAPNVAQIAEEHTTDLVVGKVNVDEQRALTEKFGIMNIPTLLVFKNGSAAGRIVGFKPKEEILAQL